MTHARLRSFTIAAAAAGGILLAMALTEDPTRPPPTSPFLLQAMTAMDREGADREFWQSQIEGYYAASEQTKAMKDGLVSSAQRRTEEMRIRRAEAKAAISEFCAENRSRC